MRTLEIRVLEVVEKAVKRNFTNDGSSIYPRERTKTGHWHRSLEDNEPTSSLRENESRADHLQDKVQSSSASLLYVLGYGVYKGQDRTTLGCKCGEPGDKAKIYALKKCCALCKDCGLQKKDMANVPRSWWCHVFKE